MSPCPPAADPSSRPMRVIVTRPAAQAASWVQALQRQGIPSRFINFPDEGHWVLKPQNSAYWHREVFGWLKKYAPPGGRAEL